MSHPFDRRRFLQTAAFTLGAAGLPAWALAQKGSETFPGLIIRLKEPVNLEFPFPSLDSFVTPTEQFYVRNHFPRPKIDPATWKLSVEGAVDNPLSLTLADLKAMKPTTLPATLECAGNGRIFLVPRPPGMLWELGAVSNAEWTGIPLAALLDKAGVKAKAVEVILEGADAGEIKDPPATPGKIAYARSLPLAKARSPETLLAWQMNGADLTPDHGFPLRAVVPGWYGMAAVKWLTKIIVTEKPFQGYFQTLDYTAWEVHGGQPSMVPVTEMNVKAQIARPMLGEVIKGGSTYRVFGAAWAGEANVAKVEVSSDDGKTWSEAKLLDKTVPYCWRLWEFSWKVPAKPGRVTLMARAPIAKVAPTRRSTILIDAITKSRTSSPSRVEVR